MATSASDKRSTFMAMMLVLATFAAMLGGCTSDSMWMNPDAATDTGPTFHTGWDRGQRGAER